MKIGLIGAFDRNNYGDILMPIIVEKQIRENFPNKDIVFEYYGQSYSNMEYTLGKNTIPLSEISKNKCDIAIFVGGEILSAVYRGMYLNLLESKIKILEYKILKKFFPKYTERKCKKNLKGISIKPWIVSKKDINCKYLIYNTVGGNVLNDVEENEKKDIKEIFNTVDYISIREKDSFNILKEFKDDVKLYPDSVINLSKLIADDEIEVNTSEEIKSNVKRMDEYFVFQIKKIYGKKHISNIVNQIKEIYKSTGLKCILLPIGYAQGHEDHIILKEIYKKLDKDNCYMPSFNNIYETIYIIKNSKMFLGTSLHGIITAISYNLPHIIATTNLKKLNSFVNTWDTSPIVNCEIDEMCNSVENVMKNYEEITEFVKKANMRLQKLVDENFKNINKYIEEVK